MKSSFVLFALSSLVASATAFATPVPVSQDQLADYAKAAALAINQGTFSCVQVSGNYEGNVIDRLARATSATLDSDGVQPLLVFTRVETYGNQKVVSITTSSDYKTILSIVSEDFVKTEINSGDLRHPYFTAGYRSSGRLDCKNTTVRQ